MALRESVLTGFLVKVALSARLRSLDEGNSLLYFLFYDVNGPVEVSWFDRSSAELAMACSMPEKTTACTGYRPYQ